MPEKLAPSQPENGKNLSQEDINKRFNDIMEYNDMSQPAMFDAEGNISEGLLEDEVYAENARRDALATQPTEVSPNRMTPGQESLDSMEQTTTPDSIDYTTHIANSADRISKWLSTKAESYENAGGVKGLAKKALRRIGSAAYRKSGLQSGVEKVRDVSDKIENKAALSADKVKQAREALMTRCAAAYERSIQRAIERERNKKQRKEQREIRARERREEEVRKYIAAINRKAERTKEREHARAERKRALGELKEAGKDYLRNTKTAKIGRAALYQARGVGGYARGVASSLHEAGKTSRREAMKS